MQNLNPNHLVTAVPEQAEDDQGLDLAQILGAARRGWRLMLYGTVLGASLGVAYFNTTTPVYTAKTDISIGTSQEIASFQEISGFERSGAGELDIATQLQILYSEDIAGRVVDQLALTENGAFLAQPQTGISRLIGLARGAASSLNNFAQGIISDDAIPVLPASDVDLAAGQRQAAIDRLRSRLSVTPVRGSRVLTISYTSISSELSARVANGVADVYIEDQIASKYAATQRASEWLRDRSEQLRVQSQTLDSQVEEFRTANGLLAGGEGLLGTDGEYQILTQRMADANAELVELEARSTRLNEIVARGDINVVVNETAGQGITAGLRARYLETLSTYNRLVASLGDDHAQVQRRRGELDEILVLMFEEVKRTAELANNEVAAAAARVRTLEEALNAAAEELGADTGVIVQLRELERNAETVRDLYTSFLQRYQQSLQQQEVPISNARVLNLARPSSTPSAPSFNMIVGGATVLGFLLAAAWIAIREFRDNKLRTEEQIREVLGLEFLGGLAILKGLKQRLTKKEIAAVDRDKREVGFPQIMRYAVEKPLSNFSETLRTGKMSVTLRHGDVDLAPKIGILSCFPNEGKTTVSANFASLLASQGAKVILIDADMRNPGLTRSLGDGFEQGLVDILLGKTPWRDIYHSNPETGLHVIPNGKGRAVHTAELIGSHAMALLLAELEEIYDYVILDLPPLGPVVDARAVLDRLDGVFFVSKWGETNINLIKQILRMDPRIQQKCFGAYMNMFDPRKAQAYGVYEGAYYYRSYYKSYYRDG